MSKRFVELTDDEWNARVDAIIAEYPTLFPRHAIMFVQAEEAGRRYRHDALSWEREKGRAYAEGMTQTPGPSWTEDPEGYVVAPLENRGTLDAG